MKIVTTYKTNSAGTGQIVAKGGGKQRTVTYDHTASPDENHRFAMVELAPVLGFGQFPRTEVVELDNGRATFYLG